ncbi:izumo sperm-egg fusion protein 2 isoform X2 [Dendropsophus ebraccatus]|uniref:izumo sperm-egg fusion protein 2 isoform X2 n=1 Tax=Dendropsophus ebraccatus TaxID=150705 RepID=UPI0038316F12
MSQGTRLFLLANVIPMAFSCFQCNSKVVEIFQKIRTDAIPTQLQGSKLRNRCDKLVEGMASNFFKDYAVKHFTGILDQNFLDALATFRNQTTIKFKYALKIYRDKACSPTECGWLKLDVFSCITCKTVKPSCLSSSACMVDEERMSFEFEEQGVKEEMRSDGLFIAGVSAFILLITLGLLSLMYWLRARALLERTMVP